MEFIIYFILAFIAVGGIQLLILYWLECTRKKHMSEYVERKKQSKNSHGKEKPDTE